MNTSVFGEVSVAVVKEDGMTKETRQGKSDNLLAMVDKILKKRKIFPESLRGIAVVSGPGSFTAVRQGVVAANTLGFLFGIPAVGVRLDEFGNDDELMTIISRKIAKARPGDNVVPFYGREPNITKPRDPSASKG